MTTQYIPHWEHPDNIEGLSFISAVKTAKEWVPKLREQADIVIVAYHGGFESDLLTNEPTERDTRENKGHRLLKEVAEIDVLITGHQHREIATVVNNVPVIQPGQRGEKVGKIVLELEKNNEGFTITNKEAELLSVENTPADEKLVRKFSSLQDSVNEWLDEVIGTTEGDMTIDNPDEARLDEHPYVEFINRVQLFYGQQIFLVQHIFKSCPWLWERDYYSRCYFELSFS